MSLDIWFKEDIANILRAANEANLSALAVAGGADPAEDAPHTHSAELRRAYREGFVAALVTLSLAFGLSTPAGTGDIFTTEAHRPHRLGEPSLRSLRLCGANRR